ncbi:hypothetical protein E4U59_007751, partial [Claviceps monticola]
MSVGGPDLSLSISPYPMALGGSFISCGGLYVQAVLQDQFSVGNDLDSEIAQRSLRDSTGYIIEHEAGRQTRSPFYGDVCLLSLTSSYQLLRLSKTWA